MTAQQIGGLVEASISNYMAPADGLPHKRLLSKAIVRLPDNGSMDAAFEALSRDCAARGLTLIGPWRTVGEL